MFKTPSRRLLWVPVVVALSLFPALTIGSGTAGAAGPPAITVTPDTGLGLNPTVQVAGSGWSPGQQVFFAECVGATINPGNCVQVDGSASTDATGSFSPVPVLVYRVVQSQDCILQSCQLLALWPLSSTPTEFATHPLSFDPTIPTPTPTPTLVGEVFAAGDPPYPNTTFTMTSVTCDPTGSSFSYHASGAASGFIPGSGLPPTGAPPPLPGNFDEYGTATWAGTSGPASINATFTITDSTGVVATGTLTGPGPGAGDDASCTPASESSPAQAFVGAGLVYIVTFAAGGTENGAVGMNLGNGGPGPPGPGGAILQYFSANVGPGGPSASLTPSPDTDLVDGQSITLTGSNWPANTTLYVLECRNGATALDGCDATTLQSYTVESNGTLPPGSEFVVTQNISTASGSVDCGLILGSCGLGGAVWPDGFGVGQPSVFDFPNNNIINFAGAQPGASVSGTMRGDDGAVLPYSTVAMCPGVAPVTLSCSGVLFSPVGPDGSFTFSNVIPGTWAIDGFQLSGPLTLPVVQATPWVLLELASGDVVSCALTLDTTKSVTCTGASGGSSVGQEVGSGDTVSTGDVSPTDPQQAAVTTPNAGAVTIEVAPTTDPAPSGFQLVGQQFTITAPVATPEDPLRFVFQIDGSVIPAGYDYTSIEVFKNGAQVAECTDPSSGQAAPDPCVSSRVPFGDGGAEITVLSSTASVWTFAVSEAPPTWPKFGFFSPVNNRPVLNVAKAGSAIPVKFGVGGDRGLEIFADGYPTSTEIECGTDADADSIEQTVTAGQSGLSYDPTTDTYTYVWKTAKTWTGTCRQLVLKFDDGTSMRANFQFK